MKTKKGLVILCFIICFIIGKGDSTFAQQNKKEKYLPLIIKTVEAHKRHLNNEQIIDDLKYMFNHYGVNSFDLTRHYFIRTSLGKFPRDFKDNKFFLRGSLYSCRYSKKDMQFLWGTTEDPADVMPSPVNERGEKLKKSFSWDKLHPVYLKKFVYPMIDKFSDIIGVDYIELDEYTLDHPCFSKTDIEQFRKDLCGEDEGIEWVYPGGKVEKIGFWEYAEFQLGIEKKNFRPDMIGNFTSYSEYLPAQIRGGGGIGDFLPCENGLLQKVLPKGGERFWRNVDLFLALQDYEYFKLCQKIYKYAKKKGIKYGVWGPHWRLVRDAQHDPYIDYVGPHTNPIRLAVTPGCSTYYGGLHMAQGKTYTYYFKQLREHLVLNERWGKGTLISYETMRPYRNPIAFYRDAFSAALTTIALAKPKFFNFEQSATLLSRKWFCPNSKFQIG